MKSREKLTGLPEENAVPVPDGSVGLKKAGDRLCRKLIQGASRKPAFTGIYYSHPDRRDVFSDCVRIPAGKKSKGKEEGKALYIHGSGKNYRWQPVIKQAAAGMFF